MGALDYYGAPSEREHIDGERMGGMLPANNSSNVYEASRLIKGGEGVLLGFTVYNSNAAAQFILLFDAAQVPANGAVPVAVFTVATVANLAVNWIPGRTFRRGIVICNSSTGPTLTIGAADCFFDAQYV